MIRAIRRLLAPVALATMLSLLGPLAPLHAAQGGGQSARAGGAQVPTDQDARQIRLLIRGLHAAIASFFGGGNIEPVMAYYEALEHYFPPMGEPQDTQAVRARLRKQAPKVKNYRADVGPMKIRIEGALATAVCEVHEQYTFDGKPGVEELMSTYILERRPEGWRIIHEHQSLIMAPPPEAASDGP
ncbi:MAG: nuclear transport factor 2 family protein [Acidobacteriota bacterium]